ncbi:MAG: rRNA (cytidine1920-2-O)/16S rRNA (cytidine1409-2-O)-methyltransferase [Actinomycetota bacterium]|jgi:23S rRNA (cytidine1920-2'-O)/16S rRNA (cytidine1409-2'-O)-methyltransferase|nr:rRNA (cytidine1920-2-O)/16S rRNA (cytidine1409-2-O)-methyltransferase [Actinomycetota bacterium]
MSKPIRLDAELVRRGLSRSRSAAKQAIERGEVEVKGLPATSAAAQVHPNDPIALVRADESFVSRGGEKLDGALARLDVPVEGRDWLDAGASTGGFTDRLLRGGASHVIALDVGYGQLAWALRQDERVMVFERTNARDLAPGALPFVPEGVTADLSFISLTLVLPALVAVAEAGADYVLLVKPQFEAGKQEVPRGGVVRDPDVWTRAVRNVVESAASLGLGLQGAVASHLPGPAGNREFFVHLRRGAAFGEDADVKIESAVDELL